MNSECSNIDSRSMRLCWLIALSATMFLQGCATNLERRTAVPMAKTEEAITPGGPNSRYWVDSDLTPMAKDGIDAHEREKAALLAEGKSVDPMPPAYYLAISGGGDAGAFGAGVLLGWTALGTRPTFKVVTGISTGGLMAPFAFLGPKYDPVLRHVYTSVGPDDIYKSRGLLAFFSSDGLADNRPLGELIAKFITPDFLTEVAAEYAKGRFLLIATTNIDARRPVVWNMGAVASSKHPRALQLFRDIMLASAAIPGMFSPVMIDVEVDGTTCHEMHVDGSAIAAMFLYPPRLSSATEAAGEKIAERERYAYLIRNSKFEPEWAETERRTVSIVGRAITVLLQMQGLGDTYRIFATTQRDGVDFNLAFIGADFNEPHEKEFDTPFMRKLFDYGYQQSVKGYPWRKSPPGYSEPINR